MIQPDEACGQQSLFGRTMMAIANRKVDLGRDPQYLFLGTRDKDEIKRIALVWGHAWVPVDGMRDRFQNIPVYVVDAEHFLAVH